MVVHIPDGTMLVLRNATQICLVRHHAVVVLVHRRIFQNRCRIIFLHHSCLLWIHQMRRQKHRRLLVQSVSLTFSSLKLLESTFLKDLVALLRKLVILLQTLFVESVEIDDCLIIIIVVELNMTNAFWRCGLHRIWKFEVPASMYSRAGVVFSGGAFESVFVDGWGAVVKFGISGLRTEKLRSVAFQAHAAGIVYIQIWQFNIRSFKIKIIKPICRWRRFCSFYGIAFLKARMLQSTAQRPFAIHLILILSIQLLRKKHPFRLHHHRVSHIIVTFNSILKFIKVFVILLFLEILHHLFNLCFIL